MKKVYLAIPYSGIEEESFKIANEVASILMKDGKTIVYSPISHNHPIAKAHGLPTGWDFWKQFDTEFIQWCDEVIVILLHNQEQLELGYPLHNNSKGVQAEMLIAKGLNKPFSYYKYNLL